MILLKAFKVKQACGLIFYVFLIIVESIMILVSAFISIPKCLVFIVGGSIVLIDVLAFLKKKATLGKVLILALSLFSIVWAVWSAYFMPYWGSRTICDIAGLEIPQTLNSDVKLDRDSANDDIQYAVKQIEKIHPACINQSFKIDSLLGDMIVDDSITVASLYMYLQSRVSKLGDAHTKVYPVYNSIGTIDFSQFGELLSINGMSTDDIVDFYSCYISGESSEWKQHVVSERLKTYEWQDLMGLILDGSMTAEFFSDTLGVITRRFTQEDFKKQREQNVFTESEHGSYSLDRENNIAYLYLQNCLFYTPKQVRSIKSGLKHLFSAIDEQNCENLIIDLRGNPGGNNFIARELLRYYPIDKYNIGDIVYRRGPFLLGGERTVKNRQNKDLLFHGNTYILTSLTTFSAAMQMADYFQGNGLALIIGETPGNYPNCYANITHFVLPHSKLSMTISTVKYERVDNSSGIDYIVPDIQCESSVAKDTVYALVANREKKTAN